MSSFLVENETIDRIISYLAYADCGYGLDIQKMGEAEKQSFGRAMLEMNCAALVARYGQAEAEELIASQYAFKFRLVSKMQAFKSLQCFVYQCSEGSCPKADLYKKLEGAKSSMAEEIIADLPTYEKAIWG